jgi:hypothetical protein
LNGLFTFLNSGKVSPQKLIKSLIKRIYKIKYTENKQKENLSVLVRSIPSFWFMN